MNISDTVKQMTTAEKMLAMEMIWDDFRNAETEIQSPGWHRELLMKTESRLSAGEEHITDWSSAKRELRQRFES